MAERRSRSSSSNWESLHRDLIDSILDRLVLVSDLIRFGAVCKSWNFLSLNYYKEKRILGINHQLPWLVIKPEKEKWGGGKDKLYDLTSSKISNFQCEIVYRSQYYKGCSHGWCFAKQNSAPIMFNPISGTIIPLPPFIKPIRMISRFTLSRDPSACLSSPFEVLVALSTFCAFDGVAHWKSGDKFWTYFEKSKEDKYYCDFHDFIFDNDPVGGISSVFNGKEDKYYCHFHDFIFYKDRMLGICSLNGSYNGSHRAVDVVSINIDNSHGGGMKMKKIASTPRLEVLSTLEGFLVETTKGELLMVHRYFNSTRSDIRKPFKVYKVMICSNDDSAKIIPITNLDGDSLFLGNLSQSISVSASNYPACMPNLIYFATPWHYLSTTVKVFNVEDGSVSCCSLPTGYDKTPFMPWIVPSMKL